MSEFNKALDAYTQAVRDLEAAKTKVGQLTERVDILRAALEGFSLRIPAGSPVPTPEKAAKATTTKEQAARAKKSKQSASSSSNETRSPYKQKLYTEFAGKTDLVDRYWQETEDKKYPGGKRSYDIVRKAMLGTNGASPSKAKRTREDKIWPRIQRIVPPARMDEARKLYETCKFTGEALYDHVMTEMGLNGATVENRVD